MTGLRTMEGVSLKTLQKLGDETTILNILKDAQKFIEQKLLRVKDDSLFLTPEGKLFADGIASDLFRV